MAGALGYIVRQARASDAATLLQLMRELAVFEHYIDHFRVTAEDLLARGLDGGGNRQFTALVAEVEGASLAGYAVLLEVPFTYDLRPTLILKELYIRDSARGLGIGKALMQAVILHATARNAGRLKWDVLPGN